MFELSEKPHHFYTALSGDTLLSAPVFPQLIQKLKAHTGVEDEHYAVLYETLLPTFATFAQAFPAMTDGKPGSLLIHSIERAVKALEAYYQEVNANLDIRMAYAVFTAALLQNSGKILGQQRTCICDAEGRVLEDWHPYKGSIPEGAYYRLWFLGDQWFSVNKFSAPLLARQIMPPVGFNWIAEDLPTYKMWLEALVDEGHEEDNKLLKFLRASDPIESGGGVKRLPSTILRPHRPTATIDADNFLESLIEGLATGKISVNQPNSKVFTLASGGLLLVSSLFQSLPENIYEQLSSLGIVDHIDTYTIRNKESDANQTATNSLWGTAREKSRTDHMTYECVVVQSLLFRGLSLQRDHQLRITRQHARQEESREIRSLKATLDSQQTRPTTAIS